MKFFKALLFAMMMLSAGAVIADELQVQTAVIQNPGFVTVLAQQAQLAQQKNNLLKIYSISISEGLNQNWTLHFELREKPNGIPDDFWGRAGEIVGMVRISPSGEAFVEAVYYKPDATNPGGATVGNF